MSENKTLPQLDNFEICRPLKPKNELNRKTEKMIFFTNDVIYKLLDYKDKEEIPDHDFAIYLDEAWLDKAGIEQFFLITKESRDEEKFKKLFKWFFDKTWRKETILITEKDIIQDEKPSDIYLQITSICANELINSMNSDSSPIHILEELRILWDKSDYDEERDIYEEAMIIPTKIILKNLDKEKNLKLKLNVLFDMLSNSYGEAEIIISTYIIWVIKRKNNPQSVLVDLMSCFDDATQDENKDLFMKAMLKPSLQIIEDSEILDFPIASEILKWGKANSEWEAEKLFTEENIYRDNLYSISHILQS